MQAAGRSKRAPGPRLAAALAVVVLLAGCGAGEPVPPPSASPTRTPAATAAPSPSIPVDGQTLRQRGFENGPIDAFSVPASAVTSATVDQPNVVSLVFSYPAPAEVGDYLRAALPAAGFEITAESPDGSTFSFGGHGWTGSFTSSTDTSAVVIRPA